MVRNRYSIIKRDCLLGLQVKFLLDKFVDLTLVMLILSAAGSICFQLPINLAKRRNPTCSATSS